MNKTNYHKKMLETIENLDSGKKLLLHSCCAPCSSYCLDILKNNFDITIFFYNPNIFSESEYEKRLFEQKRLIKEMNLDIDIICPKYCERDFLESIQGYENQVERGKRCHKCYYLRLKETAKLAQDKNFDYFTTTLSISPLKNADWINSIGLEMQELYNTNFLESDFKKNGGYQKSVQLSKKHNLYRQSFCGCRFSKKDSEKEELLHI